MKVHIINHRCGDDEIEVKEGKHEQNETIRKNQDS